MDARHLLEGMAARGFTVALEGEHLAVSPKSGLTPKLRDALKAHKSELVSLLSHGNPFAVRVDAQGAGAVSGAPPGALEALRGVPIGADELEETGAACRAIWRAARHIEARNPTFWRRLDASDKHALCVAFALLDAGLLPDETLLIARDTP